MALKDNLRIVIRRSQELAHNCRNFAAEAGNNPAAMVFTQIADSLDFHLKIYKRTKNIVALRLNHVPSFGDYLYLWFAKLAGSGRIINT